MAGDRRVKYTKMVLRESLIKLLQKKPISRITVKELCDLPISTVQRFIPTMLTSLTS